MKDTKFENYMKMIDKKAWEVSRKTGADFEELQAYGAYIYCYVLNRYDATKASFSTILYLALNRLYEFSGKDIGRDLDLGEGWEMQLKQPDESPKVEELLLLAKEKLADDSYRLIEWLVNRTWEFQGKIKPCLAMAVRQFGWNRKYAEAVWNDCKDFWNNCGWKLYC